MANTIQVVPMTEADIPGAIEVIQQAFEDDPYFSWVFDLSKVCTKYLWMKVLNMNIMNRWVGICIHYSVSWIYTGLS